MTKQRQAASSNRGRSDDEGKENGDRSVEGASAATLQALTRAGASPRSSSGSSSSTTLVLY